jgi:deazaflavin-dependent oxidoreductase (nitroreductase family)
MTAQTRPTTTIRLPGTPKPWMNTVMSVMLRTPGLRALLGRTFLLLTVTGAKTGRRYTTPVQYVRDGDRLLVMSQRHRRWWRNIAVRPEVEVEVVLAGRTIDTTAHLADDTRAAIATCLRLVPRVAMFYGIAIDEHGDPDPAGIDQLEAASVVIVVDLPPS